ncbi:MAG: hypothetical protein LBL33_08740 [Tannerella sp.]|jgi:hypothetical protein|nr:hypothetical protein [Tannerella sp.]
MEVITVTSQSLFDLSIQLGGHVEAVFALALENGLDITGEISAGTPVQAVNIWDRQTVDYYRVKNIKPATYTGQDVLTLTGIGYMIVEDNFIVG